MNTQQSFFSLLSAVSILFFVSPAILFGQSVRVPDVHSNISNGVDNLEVDVQGTIYSEVPSQPTLQLPSFVDAPRGTKKGLSFDFGLPGLEGTMYYGFIPYGDSKHPQPVYFRQSASIEGGKAQVNIADQMRGRYDMIGWEKNEKGTLGYRVVAKTGLILYEGRVSFTGVGPFKVDATVVEGPFVDCLTHNSAIISFETNKKIKASLKVGDREILEKKSEVHHEFLLTDLEANSEYSYTVSVGENSQSYSFQTAPTPGSRQAFVFAYASDSRSGQGGGERDVYGANYYIMKKIMALAKFQNVSFMQFSGDLIDGYLNSAEETHLQYANWKRAIEPFAHYFPVYISMGNHEALVRSFSEQEGTRPGVSVDRFPYETESAEAVFASNFVNPTNGPDSEDGASYDPRANKVDFPSYKENVFSYTYDNVAVIVLNSDYWYAPSTSMIRVTGGGLHGYIMDQQLAWLEGKIAQYEADNSIDHVFITQHTPCFPNGGHVQDDMWYNGNNQYRPYVNGSPLEKGIIERRDQILDLIVNKSQKVIGILTGDEHNYARTEVGPETPIYPDGYPEGSKIKLNRTIYQINNGAAGAPYYSQEETPWTEKVSGFTTQNALVLFHIEGKRVHMEVRNPDTLEEVDTFTLRE